MPATRAVVPLGARGNALTTNPATSENEGTFQHSTLERGGVMKELLERWAKLEPERCLLDPDGYGRNELAVSLAESEGRREYIGLMDDEFVMYSSCPYLLQAAVQEAIEARGGRWVLEMAQEGTYFANVKRGHGDYVVGGATPAEALLSAYLTALEAQG